MIGAVEVPLLVGPSTRDTVGTYALDVVRINGPAGRAEAAAAEVVAFGLVGLTALGGLIAVKRWRSGR